jgi:hypothetical protein
MAAAPPATPRLSPPPPESSQVSPFPADSPGPEMDCGGLPTTGSGSPRWCSGRSPLYWTPVVSWTWPPFEGPERSERKGVQVPVQGDVRAADIRICLLGVCQESMFPLLRPQAAYSLRSVRRWPLDACVEPPGRPYQWRVCTPRDLAKSGDIFGVHRLVGVGSVSVI